MNISKLIPVLGSIIRLVKFMREVTFSDLTKFALLVAFILGCIWFAINKLGLHLSFGFGK